MNVCITDNHVDVSFVVIKIPYSPCTPLVFIGVVVHFCPITCLHVFCPVMLYLLWFSHKNNVGFVFTPIGIIRVMFNLICYLYLLTYVSNMISTSDDVYLKKFIPEKLSCTLNLISTFLLVPFNSNMTGTTNGAEAAYPSGKPKFNIRFLLPLVL